MKTQKAQRLQPKSFTRYGVRYAPSTTHQYYAEVSQDRQSVRIWGRNATTLKEPHFDRVFKVGDWAEYDSYNLIYDGKIVKITPKTVTIDKGRSYSKKVRLTMFRFVEKNWDYDSQEVFEHNTNEMMYL